MKAVRFGEYGDVDVLEVAEVPRPAPGPGQDTVRRFRDDKGGGGRVLSVV